MRKCPRCLKDYAERPVISRRDTKTEICTACGLEEALGDLIRRGGRQLPEIVQRREDRMVAFIRRPPPPHPGSSQLAAQLIHPRRCGASFED